MPSFSEKSLNRLATCDVRLQRVYQQVVGGFDCTIIEGHRNKERQNRMVDEGKSQVRWPDGKHNTVPSMAVDVCPYPVVWDDRERQTLFAGYVLEHHAFNLEHNQHLSRSSNTLLDQTVCRYHGFIDRRLKWFIFLARCSSHSQGHGYSVALGRRLGP